MRIEEELFEIEEEEEEETQQHTVPLNVGNRESSLRVADLRSEVEKPIKIDEDVVIDSILLRIQSKLHRGSEKPTKGESREDVEISELFKRAEELVTKLSSDKK